MINFNFLRNYKKIMIVGGMIVLLAGVTGSQVYFNNTAQRMTTSTRASEQNSSISVLVYNTDTNSLISNENLSNIPLNTNIRVMAILSNESTLDTNNLTAQINFVKRACPGAIAATMKKESTLTPSFTFSGKLGCAGTSVFTVTVFDGTQSATSSEVTFTTISNVENIPTPNLTSTKQELVVSIYNSDSGVQLVDSGLSNISLNTNIRVMAIVPNNSVLDTNNLSAQISFIQRPCSESIASSMKKESTMTPSFSYGGPLSCVGQYTFTTSVTDGKNTIKSAPVNLTVISLTQPTISLTKSPTPTKIVAAPTISSLNVYNAATGNMISGNELLSIPLNTKVTVIAVIANDPAINSNNLTAQINFIKRPCSGSIASTMKKESSFTQAFSYSGPLSCLGTYSITVSVSDGETNVTSNSLSMTTVSTLNPTTNPTSTFTPTPTLTKTPSPILTKIPTVTPTKVPTRAPTSNPTKTLTPTPKPLTITVKDITVPGNMITNAYKTNLSCDGGYWCRWYRNGKSTGSIATDGSLNISTPAATSEYGACWIHWINGAKADGSTYRIRATVNSNYPNSTSFIQIQTYNNDNYVKNPWMFTNGASQIDRTIVIKDAYPNWIAIKYCTWGGKTTSASTATLKSISFEKVK